MGDGWLSAKKKLTRLKGCHTKNLCPAVWLHTSTLSLDKPRSPNPAPGRHKQPTGSSSLSSAQRGCQFAKSSLLEFPVFVELRRRDQDQGSGPSVSKAPGP